MGNIFSVEPFTLKEINESIESSKATSQEARADLLSQINNITTNTNDDNIENQLSNLIQDMKDNQTETGTNEIDSAKQKYINARNIAKNAPENLRKAKQTFFIEATGSKQQWTNLQIETYKRKAEQEKKILIDTHKNEMKRISASLNSYKNNFNNRQLLTDYINKIKKENDTLKKKLDGMTSKVSVSERKVWYGVNEINDINNWKTIAQIIYTIIVIIYIGLFFQKGLWKENGKRNHYIDISLVIFFIIWPFISNSISILFIYLINWFIEKIPIDPYGRLYRDYSKDFNYT